MTSLTLFPGPYASVAADAIILPMEAGPSGPRLADAESWPKDAAQYLTSALAAVGATGKPGELVKLPAPDGFRARAVIVCGLPETKAKPGDPTTPDQAEALRRAAGEATRAAEGYEAVALAFPASDDHEVGAIGVGAWLGTYRFDAFRTTKKPALPTRLIIAGPAAKIPRANDALARASVICEQVTNGRDLVNTPANKLNPALVAERVKELAKPVGATVEVLDEEALAAGGYGGILAVGQGSINPPRLVKVSWKPPKVAYTLALVGKGITFDSGGLSLKPPKAQETMKCDMAGAATVLGAVLAAARFKLPIAVTAWLALAENMPSGKAQRPGDIITMLDGTTVEVLNTDAEGRLVLADAIVAARRDGADAIIDVATLTGNQVAALGERIAGVMGDSELREKVLAASRDVGEPLWPMPLPAPMKSELDSSIADVKNIAGPNAGMLTAGLFLERFAGKTPWVHIDIAGPAFNTTKPYGHVPEAGTGWGIRTLITLLRSHL
ncbi:MAG: leucyl aminopeptidase [Micrococcales bacterium]|nr:leucyl aminopeptidase [Micrococcales bacterium]